MIKIPSFPSNTTDTAVISSIAGLSVGVLNDYLVCIGLILAIPIAIYRLRIAMLEHEEKLKRRKNPNAD